MRKFTYLFLTAALLVIGVGGAKATKTNWNPSNWVASWNGETKTMSWNGTDGYKVMNTGFPTGNLSTYTKIRATITSITGENDYIQLKVSSEGKNDQMINLTKGVNNVVFSSYDINLNNVTEITLWGTGSSDGSAVITEMYLYNPVKTISVATGFGDEITTLDYITGGNKFVISDNGTNAKYFFTNNENENAAVTNVPADAYFYFTLEKYTGDVVSGDNVYKIKITNAAGDGYPKGSDGVNNYYLNAVLNYADVVISGTKDGWGGNIKAALWYVTYDAEKGFSFQNVYRFENNPKKWLSVSNNFQNDQQYLKLYKSIEFATSTDFEKEDNAANDAIFSLANATGYNAETGILKDGGWTFATPVDLSDWDYLIITTEETQREDNTYIRITDNDGNYVEQSGYAPGNEPEMYFSVWNNHNAACISMDYLRNVKGLDISKIKSLAFSGIGLKISSVYLTDYKNTKLGPGRGRYALFVDGDVVRNYTESTVGKFGTICLPYVASCAGAEVYSIAGTDGSSISLTKVNGLLEAGKPYFYKASDTKGKKNEDVHNVNFFRADFDIFDAASPVANNGLIGTFNETTAPQGENYLVLSDNQLWRVNSLVTVGANKAYIDLSAITNASSRGAITIDFGETNGIVTTAAEQGGDEIYSLSGQRVSQLRKGLYIKGGKKVLVK